MVILTMPLSRVQLSPLSVRVTGELTAGLATFGNTWVAGCATALDDRRTARARNVEPKRSLALLMMQPFRTTRVASGLMILEVGERWPDGRSCGQHGESRNHGIRNGKTNERPGKVSHPGHFHRKCDAGKTVPRGLHCVVAHPS